MKKKILEIENLNASINGKHIIKDLNLIIKEKELHLIMGPNGSGKSTLSNILIGNSNYVINSGIVTYLNNNLLIKTVEERAKDGLFLGFQYPLEISGISNYDFLYTIYNKKQKALNQLEINPIEFLNIIIPLLNKLNLSNNFLNRDLNQGFSGGEKKLNEILQMLLLKPKLAIFDEIDSGLDIDAIKKLSNEITKNYNEILNLSTLIFISHNPDIINYFNFDYIHIMINGRIEVTGNTNLLKDLKKNGYEYFKKK